MKNIPFLGEDIAANGANREVIITHEDLTVATVDTAQTIALLSFPGLYHMVELVRMELLEAFEATADSASLTTLVEVGDGSDTDRLLTSTQLNKNGTEVFMKAGTGVRYVYASADTVDIVFAAPTSGKNLAALNKGKLRLLFNIYDARDARGTV